MKALGFITSVFVTSIAVLAAVVAVKSLPDMRRYLKMRSM